jgi:hypothetical protein
MTEPFHRTTTLAAELARVAQELRAQEPPASLRTELQRSLRPRRRWLPVTLASAGAALLALLVIPVLFVDGGQPDVAVQANVDTAGFVPVSTADDWRQAARNTGGVWLVSTEMPRERLAALGLPYDPARAGERVRAELLMRPSGDVLAVRVMP